MSVKTQVHKEDMNQFEGQSLMRYKDLARYLQVSQTKLRHDVMMGIIPHVKIGACVRFVKSDIDGWLKKNAIMPEGSHE